MILVLGISASVQAQDQDSFAAFEGKWRHTDLYCRSFNGGKMQERPEKLIKGGFDGFYPDVELKFSTTYLNINGKIVPAKNLEKAITQGSCSLEKPIMSPLSQKANPNYVWSKNRIKMTPKANLQGVQYYEMEGYLLDKNINYSDILDCGRNDAQPMSIKGAISALFTFVRYSMGKSYFNVEADRKYTISISKGKLDLEFFDTTLCDGDGERVVMQFEKATKKRAVLKKL